ncbi:MAG: DUF58 domain-containing protein [Phycisphaerae bacterium]
MSKRRKRSPRGSGREFLRFRMTDAGKLLAIGTMMAVAIGAVSLEVPIYTLFVTLLVLFVIAAAVGTVYWPRLLLGGGFEGKAVANHVVRGHYTLTNRTRLAAYDVSVGHFDLPEVVERVQDADSVGRLAPGETVELSVAIRPLRRGLHTLAGLRYFTTFPFNLFRTGPRTGREEKLLVLPEFRPLSQVDIPIGTRYQPGGIALTSHVGERPEYIGNRNYRPGDPFRRVDPRAWARLGTPVVKEYQEEYYCRIALVLDTYVPRRRGKRGKRGFDDLEAGVSMTAAVADALSKGEHIIDLFAAGPDLYVFRSGRHTAHLDNVLEILACVEDCRTNPFEKITPALSDELSNISAVVFVMLDWDESRRRLVRMAVEAGCATRVVIVREGEPRPEASMDEGWAGHIMQVTPQQVRKGGIDRI